MSEKTYLTREQVLATDDRGIEEVDCPEWGGTLRVRALSCAAFEELTAFAGSKRWIAAMVAASLVDEKGEQLFTIEEVEKLAKRKAAPMRRLFAACNRLNASDEATIAELEKNSEPSRLSSSSLN